MADVVAHIIERGRPIPDQIERGLAGDLSPTPGVSDAPPEDEDVFRRQLDHSAVALRRELGDNLLPEFARLNREFDRVLSLPGRRVGGSSATTGCAPKRRGPKRTSASRSWPYSASAPHLNTRPYGGALAAGGRPAEIA